LIARILLRLLLRVSLNSHRRLAIDWLTWRRRLLSEVWALCLLLEGQRRRAMCRMALRRCRLLIGRVRWGLVIAVLCVLLRRSWGTGNRLGLLIVLICHWGLWARWRGLVVLILRGLRLLVSGQRRLAIG
jgi:hypothetical protein